MKRSEKGFTLIEMIVAISIVALIAGGASMSIFQVVNINTKSTNHMTAVKQVQNAGYWISHDALMAQRVELGVAPGFPLSLTWTEWDSSDEHQVIYTLEDMPGSELKKLKRSYSINGGADEANFVAQYIDPDPAKTKCEFTDGILIFMVTATVSLGSQVESETRVYKVIPRPSL